MAGGDVHAIVAEDCGAALTGAQAWGGADMNEGRVRDWSRIAQLFHELKDLEGEAHDTFLTTLARESPDDASVLRDLTERDTDLTGFLSPRAPNAPSAQARDATLQAGDKVGAWVIEDLIGSGGMGHVYRARRHDGLYDQTVALKVAMSAERDRMDWFERERRQLARLDHPGIARIIDGGQTADERPFLAMEYIDGQSITIYAAAQALSVNARIDLFLQLCRAVAHAHAKLLLHRDIKPDNVLVDANANVRLIDFGVSSLIGGAQAAGGPMTVAYAAPEQLKGGEVGVGADVFMLGVNLYQLLAGARPERQADAGVRIDPRRVRHPEWTAVIARATHTDPAARYQTVDALAEDLERVRAGASIDVYSTARSYRLRKLIARNPVSSALSVAVVGALVAGLAATAVQARIAQAERVLAERALADKEWQYARGDAMLLAQSAYADILYAEFGESEGGGDLTQRLMTRWQEAQTNRDTDPDKAAATSFALFRNFYLRRDYANARLIADAWLAEAPYGSPALIDAGNELYGMFLFDTGARQEALPVLRTLLAQMEEQTTRTSMDKMSVANRVAVASLERGDYEKAEFYMLKLVDEAVRPENYIEAYGSLGILNENFGEYEKADQFYALSLEPFDANPDLALPSRALLRARRAKLLLLELDRPDDALALAQRVTSDDVAQTGESAITGRAYWVQARAHLAGRNASQAQAAVQREITLAQTYEGAGPTPALSSRLARVRIAALEERWDEAQSLLDEIAAEDPAHMEAALTQLSALFVAHERTEDRAALGAGLDALGDLAAEDSETRWLARALRRTASDGAAE